MSGLLSRIRKSLSLEVEPETEGRTNVADELRRLSNSPRYEAIETSLLGVPLVVPDGPSAASMWRSIFQQRIYEFPSQETAPRILDCGANIGLSCVFFARLFPQSRITAFEPDPKIVRHLKKTLDATGVSNVQVIERAVWSSATTLHFHSEGADGGRVDAECDGTVAVETVRLREFLDEPISFLKLDIEGAETEVLLDCQGRLENVERVFVEYHSFSTKAQSLDVVLRVLKDAGFRVQLQPELVSSQPFMRVQRYLDMDLQVNVFGYRT